MIAERRGVPEFHAEAGKFVKQHTHSRPLLCKAGA